MITRISMYIYLRTRVPLQRHCNTLQHTVTHRCSGTAPIDIDRDVAITINVFCRVDVYQHSLTQSNVLQCVAVCCSVLQCVAVCCSVLQCVAVCCSVSQRIAACCSMLQSKIGLDRDAIIIHVSCRVDVYLHLHRAVCCSVSQCVAVCCSTLECVEVCCSALQCAEVCCSVLQCVAVCCSVLQCVAVCCSVLQCVAMYQYLHRLEHGRAPAATTDYVRVVTSIIKVSLSHSCVSTFT